MSTTAPDHAHARHSPALEHQFDDLDQQDSAISLGMWVFLATEVMFFGGLFASYIMLRCSDPDFGRAFADAAKFQNIGLGTLNTGVLLCSSLAMALAVHASQEGHRRSQVVFLLLTIVLGMAFLGIKGYEWSHEYHEHKVPGINFRWEGDLPRQAELYFVFYFAMTGLHALHMMIGIGILGTIAGIAYRRGYHRDDAATVEAVGLYWHFVDIVWVFLFPLLYLIDIH